MLSPSASVLQGSVLSLHLYLIYINTLIPLLRSAVSASTTSILSFSPSGPSHGTVPGFPFGPVTTIQSLFPSATPINTLLYTDDVALIGSAHEVRHMLDLFQTHIQVLGYKWALPKCAVLNSPSSTSSRYVHMFLYDEALSPVEEFSYLGVPFDGQGISVSVMVSYRSASTLALIGVLASMGLNRQGLSLLLSSRL